MKKRKRIHRYPDIIGLGRVEINSHAVASVEVNISRNQVFFSFFDDFLVQSISTLIGFAKCGTGALAFLDCHSNIVTRSAEPVFFNSYNRYRAGLSEYAIPDAATDEILIEKTPDYLLGRDVN